MFESIRKTPKWPYLCILGCLFILSVTAPQAWEKIARDQPIDEVLAMRVGAEETKEETSSESTPRNTTITPAESSPEIEISSQEEQDNSEAVLAQVERPPSVILDWPPAAQETTEVRRLAEPAANEDEISTEASENVSTHPEENEIPSVELLPEVPGLPEAEDLSAPLQIDEVLSTPSAIEDVDQPVLGWPSPEPLLELLEALSNHKPCADWASRVRLLVRDLTTKHLPKRMQAESVLRKLRQALDEVKPLLAKIDQPSVQSDLRRVQRALLRRLDIWELVHSILVHSFDRVASRKTLAIQARTARQRMSLCLRNVRALTESHSNGKGWQRYLKLSELEKLAAQDPLEPSQDQLAQEMQTLARTVLRLLEKAKQMKQQRAFIVVNPLAQLENELREWTVEKVDPEQLLRQLLRHIEQYELSGLPSHARLIANDYQRLAWAPRGNYFELGHRLDKHYRDANVRIAVTGELLNRLVPQPKPIQEDVDEFIGGVKAVGISNTTTEIFVRLVPDPLQIRAGVEALGTVNSQTVSEVGLATIYSDGISTFLARRLIVIGPERFDVWPSIAEADSDNDVEIQTRVFLIGGLVQSIVRSQHKRREEDISYEVEEKIADKARKRLDADADLRIRQVREEFDRNVVSMLQKLLLDPRVIDMYTTKRRVVSRFRLAGSSQLGSHTPRPFAPSNSLASLQIHQSAINNILENLELSGKTFELTELFRWIGEKLDRTDISVPDDIPGNLKITFADKDAVTVRCEDSRMVLELAIARLKTPRRQWKNFTIRARYKPVVDQLDAKLVRDGSIQLISNWHKGKAQFVLRSIFTRALSISRPFRVLPKKLLDDPRLKDLEITQFVLADGWIGLALGPRRSASPRQASLQTGQPRKR